MMDEHGAFEFGPADPDALMAFREHMDEIIAEAVRHSMQHADEFASLESGAERIIQAGLTMTCRMVDAAMETGHQELLNEDIEWARTRLPHENVSHAQVLSQLDYVGDAVRTVLLPEHAEAIHPYFRWLLERFSEESGRK